MPTLTTLTTLTTLNAYEARLLHCEAKAKTERTASQPNG